MDGEALNVFAHLCVLIQLWDFIQVIHDKEIGNNPYYSA